MRAKRTARRCRGSRTRIIWLMRELEQGGTSRRAGTRIPRLSLGASSRSGGVPDARSNSSLQPPMHWLELPVEAARLRWRRCLLQPVCPEAIMRIEWKKAAAAL